MNSRKIDRLDVKSCNRAWYLIYSKPRQEHTAKENLLRQDYQVYLPQMRHWKRKRGRLILVIEPMFPRYLFISLSFSIDNCEPIRSTLGVVGLVRFGQMIAAVPKKLVEQLQSIADPYGVYSLPKPDLNIGDRVRIVAGIMQDYVGIITAKSGRERVDLLIAAVTSGIKIQLPMAHVEKIV